MAGLLALGGLWVASRGGYLLLPVGGAVVALAAVLGIAAFRRLRFAQEVNAPGWVEVDEGQVGYLGPAFGGYVALPDLVEIRLLSMRGRRLWAATGLVLQRIQYRSPLHRVARVSALPAHQFCD